jgi:organic radical activating enzyme
MAQRYKDRPELRQARVNAMTGDSNPMKDPEIALKAYLTREEERPKTGAESRFEIATYGLPVKFVGHGDLVVGHKVPDFVVEGQKKVIEVWAEDAQHAQERDDEWKQKRAEIFAKEGYETLFIAMPKSGVRNGAYDSVRKEVSEFIHNGDIVEEVTHISKGSGPAWTRLANAKHADCDVFNLEVEDTHTYIANSKVVHNCDTYFDSGETYGFDDLFEMIEEDIHNWFTGQGMETPEWAKGKNKRMVLVITGGEPALQTNLTDFLAEAGDVFQRTQIESNGTLLLECPGTTYVCSPKCAEKNGRAIKYLTPRQEVLDRADCLKFVMCHPDNDPFGPYSTIPDWAHDWAERTGKPVYVSPMNMYNDEPQKAKELRAANQGEISIEQRSTVDEVISFWERGLLNMEENQKNHEYTAAYAMKHGLRLNLQVHLFASLP